jgi:hypothetical protein
MEPDPTPSIPRGNLMRRTVLWASLLALVLVVTGTTSYAASKYVVTSSKQVKNGSLTTADLSKASRSQLRGATGATGATGAQGAVGPVGPSHAYADSLTTTVPIAASTSETLLSAAVPAGTYVVSARIQGQTGNEPDPGNNFRFDCALSGPGVSFDAPVYRVGTDPNVERYLTFQGAGTTTGAGTIALTCYAGNAHALSVITGQLTVVAVGGLN